MYTARPLLFTSRESHIALLDEDDGSGADMPVLSHHYVCYGSMVLGWHSSWVVITLATTSRVLDRVVMEELVRLAPDL